MFIQTDMNGFLEMYIEMQTKNTVIWKYSSETKQSGFQSHAEFTVYLTVYNVKFFSDDTSLECSFETRQCFLENTSEGDDFDWALNSVSTII